MLRQVVTTDDSVTTEHPPLASSPPGPLLEFWFIPDIKSPSRLAICFRSRLDDVAAGPLHCRNLIKRNPCEAIKWLHRAQVGTSSRFCTSCLSSASGCCLQHMFQDFKLLMLSQFVIASRCSRLVVIVLCLVSADFQQPPTQHSSLSKPVGCGSPGLTRPLEATPLWSGSGPLQPDSHLGSRT